MRERRGAAEDRDTQRVFEPADGRDEPRGRAGGEHGSGGEGSGQSGSAQSGSGQSGSGGSRGPTKAEWVVGGISTALVLALLGYILYLAITGVETPPLIQLDAQRVIEAPGGYVVEVRARNAGGTTASALEIEGTLKQDTVTVERSTATIQYVPEQAERQLGLFFTKNPADYRLELRPLGYDRP